MAAQIVTWSTVANGPIGGLVSVGNGFFGARNGARTIDAADNKVVGSYRPVAASSAISRVGIRWRYRADRGARPTKDSGVCIAILQGAVPPGFPDRMVPGTKLPKIGVHLTASATGTSLDYSSGQVLTNLARWPIALDPAIEHVLEAELVAADTVKVSLDTAAATITNSGILAGSGIWSFTEIRYANGNLDAPVEILSEWVDNKPIPPAKSPKPPPSNLPWWLGWISWI